MLRSIDPATRRFTADNAGTAVWLLAALAASVIIVTVLVTLKPAVAAVATIGLLLLALILLYPVAGVMLFVGYLYLRPDQLVPDFPDTHIPLILSLVIL